jgi:aminopeptidase YwaD
MDEDHLVQNCLAYLKKLCVEIPERCVGSHGNRQATRFFEEVVRSCGWETETQEFEALDWEDGGAVFKSGQETFEVHVSPYSLGCEAEARLASASSLEELEGLELKGKILLLYGEIAREQLMPKNFVFYNPEEHRRIIALLEEKEPLALVCATGRNPALAGGAYPFPLIEDGDFDIPSVYMTEEEGIRLLAQAGKLAALKSNSRRIPGKGYNVLGRKGNQGGDRIVITAHIDAKKGTPGAIDNATGVIVLLLLAQMLEGYDGDRPIELVAFNGEDYYAVPGQMAYVRANQNRFDEILLNINIDGAGYREGPSAFSFFGLPDEIKAKAEGVLAKFTGILEGVQWAQGDHSIFVQYGRPAIAVTSQWFLENIDGQTITHTPKDSPEIVDLQKVVEIAAALSSLVRKI